jgi:hypothetical protein
MLLTQAVRAKPFGSPFALRVSKGRTVHSGQALSKHEQLNDPPFDRLRVNGFFLFMEKGKKTFGLQCLYNYGPINNSLIIWLTNQFAQSGPPDLMQ